MSCTPEKDEARDDVAIPPSCGFNGEVNMKCSPEKDEARDDVVIPPSRRFNGEVNMSCSLEKDEGPRDGIAIPSPPRSLLPSLSPPLAEVQPIRNKEPCVPPEVVFNVEATNTGIISSHSSNLDHSGRRAYDATRMMSKILIPLAVGGMFMVAEMRSFQSMSRAGVLTFSLSLSLMLLGLNIKFKFRKAAKWLERVGHMLFFIGLMLVCSPIIIGPKHPRYFWIPPLVAALLFASSVYFG